MGRPWSLHGAAVGALAPSLGHHYGYVAGKPVKNSSYWDPPYYNITKCAFILFLSELHSEKVNFTS